MMIRGMVGSLGALPSTVGMVLAFVSTVLCYLHALPQLVVVNVATVPIGPRTILHSIGVICVLDCDFIPDDTCRYALQVHLLQHRALVVLGLASFGWRRERAVHTRIAIECCGDEPSGA